MANYKEYRIAIDNNLVGIERVDPGTGTLPSEAVSGESKSQSGVSKAIAVHMGQKAFQYMVSNYGELTGNYYAQEQINAALQITGMIGMAATGLVGAIVVGAQLAVMGIDRAIEVNTSRRTSRVLQERYGIALGGSR